MRPFTHMPTRVCIWLQVAVGMHHVAVVASKLHSSGRLPEETRRCKLLVWGRGGAGQLGSEQPRDHNLPQVCTASDVLLYLCCCICTATLPHVFAWRCAAVWPCSLSFDRHVAGGDIVLHGCARMQCGSAARYCCCYNCHVI